MLTVADHRFSSQYLVLDATKLVQGCKYAPAVDQADI
jgi:hypothetical protein